ncbi:dual OB domain-containing protein [Nostoc sp. WHI]|uniref:dual OB domain-containing protein n=1 Tax=Nostoc sp. WHI TaxID=2650611 RepID=UPI0018C5B9F8|nr:hypothetical protein [Nostoc sp. WHI]MBG1269442.1 hypothetical protein [Nostoc sp. WHI]
MSSLKRIICLANSWKLKERYIAGIDLDTDQWIRPVCDRFPNDGRVPRDIRLVDGREPELLDILAIPLADTGEDFGFESENLTILSGKWQLLGKAIPTNLFPYCGNHPHILYNSIKYVNISYLQSLPFQQRRTLQLIHVINFSVQAQRSYGGVIQWKGTLETSSGQKLTDANITDPVFVAKLEVGYQTTGEYLVTVSLGMPWTPENWEGEAPSWKLIAGVIEIPKSANQQNSVDLVDRSDLIAQTDREMQRIGLNVEQGCKYLQQNFNKRSRQLLTLTELAQFLSYLQSLSNAPSLSKPDDDDFNDIP